MIKIQCQTCGKERMEQNYRVARGMGLYCSVKCCNHAKIKNNLGNFEGNTITIDSMGYPIVSALKKRLHVLKAERALGRLLPKGAQIHHVDGNKLNFRNDNLVVLQNNQEHRDLHEKQEIVSRILRSQKRWIKK